MRVDSPEIIQLMAFAAVLILALGWIIVMMMERSSSRERTSLDDKFFLRLSKKVGRDWKHLAIYLGFRDAELQTFVANNIGNLQEQCREMLVDWHSKQTDEEEAMEKLRLALLEMGRQELALEILGECGPRKKATSGNWAQDAADRCQQALKGRYMTTGSYIQIIPWVPDDMKHIMDIYTKLELAKDNDDVNGKVDVYDDIFGVKTREGHPVKLAICSGLPGVGKSILIDKIAYDWAEGESKTLYKYKLVFVLKMHKLEQHSDLIDAVFDQLLAEDKAVNRSDLKSYIDNNQDKVLILLDGFDEFMTTDLNESKFGSILKILNRKVGTEIEVLITTRPSHYGTLVSKSLIQRPFCHVKVLGFSGKDIEQYIKKFFSGKADKVSGLLERIESSDVLSDLAKSPMLLLLMCLLWSEYTTLPSTMSRLYDKSVEYIFRRKKLTRMSDIVVAIGKVALDGLVPPIQRLSLWERVFKFITGLLFDQERIEFTPEQRLSFQEGEFEKSVLDGALRAGILSSHRVMKGLDTDNNVHFAHKTFQEFCAAKYCQSLVKTDAGKFQSILDQITYAEGVEYLLRFCCGDNEPCTNAILKMLLKTRPENSWDPNWPGWLKLTLPCYFECQTEKLPPVDVITSVLRNTLRISTFTSDHLTALSYFLKCVAVNQSKGSVHNYLVRVKCIDIYTSDLWRCGDLFLQFKQMPNLRTLRCSNFPLTPDGDTPNVLSFGVSSKLECQQVWSSLQELQQLRKFEFSWSTLTGEDMKHIADTLSQLPDLVELDLSFNTFSGVLFSHLKEMKYLQKLSLMYCDLTGKDLKHIVESLSNLPNLVELDLSLNETLQGSFSHLKEMKHLHKLNLRLCDLTGVDLNHIAESLSEMPNLAELDLSLNFTLGSLDTLVSCVKEMKYLQKLRLGRYLLTEAVKAQLAALPVEVT